VFLHEARKKEKHDFLNTIQVIMVTVSSSKEKMTKMMSMLVIQVLEFTTPKNKLGCLQIKKTTTMNMTLVIVVSKHATQKKTKMTRCIHCNGLIG
jgi:phosphoribosylanthranilate isomerase